MRKNKKLIMAMAIILAIATAAAGSTFAWFTSVESKDNHMETGQFTNGDVKIGELFDETDDFGPGVDINKDVWAVNTGSVDALVRMTFAEALTLLQFGGEPQTGVTSGPVGSEVFTPYGIWDGTVANSIPQLFNAASLTGSGAFAGYKNFTDDGIPAGYSISGSAIPADVEVLYRETILNPGTANETKRYDFAAYATISGTGTDYDGKLQVAYFELDVDNTAKTLTFSDWGFPLFVKATAPLTYDWTAKGKTLPTPVVQPLKNTFADTDTTTPSVAALATPRRAVAAYSDPNGYIELLFTNKVKTDLSACVLGDWWYNEGDGFFYFIGKVAPGQSTTQMLDAVGLNPGAGIAYCLMEYDLTVKMEAIQNVKEALTATAGGGWALSDAKLAGALTVQDFIDHLDNLSTSAFSLT